MATKKDNETMETADDGRVEIFIPKGYANDEPNLFVGINGVNYVLPKGKTSRVPPHVADEVKRSLRAQEAQDHRIEQLKDAAK